MFKLTAGMEKRLRDDLRSFHKLFDVNRCKGTELEELLFRAIKADRSLKVVWNELKHGEVDMIVEKGGKKSLLQIKSGKVTATGVLVVSGPRLGRFDGNLAQITKHLNAGRADMLAIPYRRRKNGKSWKHDYQICYVAAKHMRDIKPGSWDRRNGEHRQINKHGVVLRLRRSLSWQVWWDIPAKHVVMGKLISM